VLCVCALCFVCFCVCAFCVLHGSRMLLYFTIGVCIVLASVASSGVVFSQKRADVGSAFFEGLGEGGEHPLFSSFGGFGDGGGGPPFFEQHARQPREPPKPKGPVDTTTYYKLLEVDKKATQDQIRRAFLQASLRKHPDKGGDKEEYKKIVQAYECLSDKKTRRAYDQGGKDAVEEVRQMKSQQAHMDKMMGRGKGKKCPTLTYNLRVSLEDVYNGKKKRIRLNRDALCDKCGGEKTLNQDIDEQCNRCNGKGQVMRMRQMGRGLLSQQPAPCPMCQGSGTCIPEKDKCRKCRGTGCQKEAEVISISVEPGMSHGQKIVLKGEADQKPGFRAGDLHILLEVQKNPRFKREGDILVYKKTLTAKEALLGFSFPLKHLDNRTIWIRSRPGKVTQPGTRYVIANEGMTHWEERQLDKKTGFEKGDLVVEFDVAFPDMIDGVLAKKIKEVFPGPEPEEPPPEAERTAWMIPQLLPFDPNMFEHDKRMKKKRADQLKEEHKKKKQAYDADSTQEEGEGPNGKRRVVSGIPFGMPIPTGGGGGQSCQVQ